MYSFAGLIDRDSLKFKKVEIIMCSKSVDKISPLHDDEELFPVVPLPHDHGVWGEGDGDQGVGNGDPLPGVQAGQDLYLAQQLFVHLPLLHGRSHQDVTVRVPVSCE